MLGLILILYSNIILHTLCILLVLSLRFETGYVILNTVLANPKLAQQVPLQELWEWLVQVARKQVGQSRLKAVQLLLRILASIPRWVSWCLLLKHSGVTCV